MSQSARSPRQRRKDARPAEIIEAATAVFAEVGYSAANLNEVARRAGVAKGTLYLYFDTKEALFRAVAEEASSVNLAAIEKVVANHDGTVRELLPKLMLDGIERFEDSPRLALSRMVLNEACQFPDIAQIWHENVVARVFDLLARILSEAQMRGEVRSGDPYRQAFSLVGPMMSAILFRETLPATGSFTDLRSLAVGHTDIILNGLSTRPSGSE